MKQTFIFNLNKMSDLSANQAMDQDNSIKKPSLESLLLEINGSSLNIEIDKRPAIIQKIQLFDNSIYGVGFIGTKQGAFHVATYWHGDQCIRLSDGSERAIANGIYKDGNDIYVVGQEGNNAVYWKNGEINFLTHNEQNPNIASNIIVNQGDIFISGYIFKDNRFIAGYWKNGQFNEVGKVKNDTYSSGIAIDHNNVYLSGFVYNNNHTEPCYWINNVAQKMELPKDCTAYTTNINIIDSDVYVLGLYETSDNILHACYWKNGKLEVLSEDSVSCGVFEVYKDGNKLYFIGSQNIDRKNSQSICRYWEKDL